MMTIDVVIKNIDYVVDFNGKKYLNRAKFKFNGVAFFWEVERDENQEHPEYLRTSTTFRPEELKALNEAYMSLQEEQYISRAQLVVKIQKKLKEHRKRAGVNGVQKLFKEAQAEWENDRSKDFETIVWRMVDEIYLSRK